MDLKYKVFKQKGSIHFAIPKVIVSDADNFYEETKTATVE